ncbi:hypothetical protein BGZ97_009934, partial [Linnemannia gamsii]
MSLDFVVGRFVRLNQEKTFEVSKSLDDAKSLVLLIKEILVLGRRLERADETAKQATIMDERQFLDDLLDNPSTPQRDPAPNPGTLQTPEKDLIFMDKD